MVAVLVILSYQPVLKYSEQLSDKLKSQREAQVEGQKNFYKEDFLRLLERGNYVLSWDLFVDKTEPGQEPSKLFLNEELNNPQDEDAWYQDKESFINGVNEVLYRWHNDFYSGTIMYYPAFEYYITDHNSGNYLTNSYNSIERLATNTTDAMELKTKYPFYIVFQYAIDGSVQIVDYAGYSKEQMDTLQINNQNKGIIKEEVNDTYWYQYCNQLTKPSNVTIIYASQSEDFYKMNGIPNNFTNPVWDFSEAGFEYIAALAAILIAVLALLLPFIKPLGIGTGPAGRVPLELSLAGVAMVMSYYENLLTTAWETATGFFVTEPSQSILSETALHLLDYIANLLLLVLLGTILYVSVLSFRRIFVIGLRRYLREQTLTGRVIGWMIRLIKKFFLNFSNIDLTDRSNKLIIKLLAVNFVILALFCSIWVLGIAVLIPYTLVLFILMRKYVEDIKLKYSILLGAASKMAEGNLEVIIDEDIGVFEPLKEEFGKVQHGFKKAVEEEMKSQRMKTDLITNVSHDLKTPLTAIITYVDLLKDENITPEERTSYINTLDMKSQRLKHLIEDLFEVSKASSNNITLNLLEVDLVDLIKQVLLEADDKLNQAEIELRMQLPEEKIVLNLDSEKTYRIFDNLIMNIAKYAMPHSRAYITLESTPNKVTVTLKNVSAMELRFNPTEITERFVRGDQARNTEGSGLGLAIVKSFVELQGGRFEILVDGDLFKAVITWKR
jgi:signal transduction histidine kinase